MNVSIEVFTNSHSDSTNIQDSSSVIKTILLVVGIIMLLMCLMIIVQYLKKPQLGENEGDVIPRANAVGQNQQNLAHRNQQIKD